MRKQINWCLLDEEVGEKVIVGGEMDEQYCAGKIFLKQFQNKRCFKVYIYVSMYICTVSINFPSLSMYVCSL